MRLEFPAVAPPRRCGRPEACDLTPNPKDQSPARETLSAASESTLDEARLRQQAIGVKLRHMFDEIVNEPVPQDFLDILRRADDKGGGRR